MAIHLEKISPAVHAYLASHPYEAATLAPLTDALGRGFDFTSRRRFPAHITAGVLLVDDRQRVLQIHHRALGDWLNPGGHCEPGDKSLRDTALRELAEQCGVGAENIEQLGGPDATPVHIGVLHIPASDSRGEPAHRHYDFRFAFRTLATVPIRVNHKSTAHRWQPLAELGDPMLASRLA